MTVKREHKLRPLPCPFCQSDAVQYRICVDGQHCVVCDGCSARGPAITDSGKQRQGKRALLAWNRAPRRNARLLTACQQAEPVLNALSKMADGNSTTARALVAVQEAIAQAD